MSQVDAWYFFPLYYSDYSVSLYSHTDFGRIGYTPVVHICFFSFRLIKSPKTFEHQLDHYFSLLKLQT